MLLLQALPTVIGTAAIAPALLFLWLVIAADERPGPPARVWTAFLLGAASISLLGVVRDAVDVAVRGSGAPLDRAGAAFDPRGRRARGDRQDSRHRRRSRRGAGTFADPMDTVVYGAAAGLGFAAYENLAYLVQHQEIWRSLAALRSVLTVPFHGALGIIAGAYIAIARSGTALGAQPASPRLGAHLQLVPGPAGAAGAACRVRFSAADAAAKSGARPRSTRLMLGTTSLLIGFGSIGVCGSAGAAGRPSSRAAHRDRARAAQPVAANVGAAGGGRRRRICRPRLRADLDPPLVRQSRPQRGAGAGADRPDLHPDRRWRCWWRRRRSIFSAATACARPRRDFRPLPEPGLNADRLSGMSCSPRASPDAADLWDDKTRCCAIERAMITIATSNYWYFSFDSSLAVGGSRSI